MSSGWPALLVVFAALYSIHLGATELTPIDESRSALIVRDCLRGNWVLPRTPDGHLSEKPPLYYWMAAGLTAALGEGEWPMRLPSVAFALATLAIVGWTASRMGGPAAGMMAVAVLGSNVLFVDWARTAMVDMVFTFFFTSALAAYLAARTRRLDPWAASVVCGVSIGLAVLTKGPAGLVFAAAVGAVDLLISTRGRFWNIGRAWAPAAVSFGIAIVVSLIWYLPACLAGGSEFLFTSVLDENFFMPLGISHGIAGSHVKPAGYYLSRQLTILLPVAVLLPEAIRRLVRKEWGTGEKLLVAAIAAVSMVLAAASNKRWYYLLPLQPALAVLIGLALASSWTEPAGAWLRVPVRFAGALLALVALAAASCAFTLPGQVRVLDALHHHRGLLALAGTAVSWVGFLMFGMSFGSAGGILRAVVAAAIVITGLRPVVIDPMEGRLDRVRPFVAELASHVPSGARVAVWPPGYGYGLEYYWPALERGASAEKSAEYLLVRRAQVEDLPFPVETLSVLRFSSAGRDMALVRKR